MAKHGLEGVPAVLWFLPTQCDLCQSSQFAFVFCVCMHQNGSGGYFFIFTFLLIIGILDERKGKLSTWQTMVGKAFLFLVMYVNLFIFPKCQNLSCMGKSKWNGKKAAKVSKSLPFEWEINLEHRHESFCVWLCSNPFVAMFQEYVRTRLATMFYLRGVSFWNLWRYSIFRGGTIYIYMCSLGDCTLALFKIFHNFKSQINVYKLT